MLVLRLTALAVAFAAAEAHSQTSVYRCVTDGVATYSDRPCAAEATTVTVASDYVSVYQPQALPKQPTRRPASPSQRRLKPDRSNNAALEKKEACAKLASSLDAIHSKLRAGYSAKEGIRLEDRRRSLKAKARELRC